MNVPHPPMPRAWLGTTLLKHSRELLELANQADDAHRDRDRDLLTATLQELHDALLALEHVAMSICREP